MSESMGKVPGKIGKKAEKFFREHVSQRVIDTLSRGNFKNLRALALEHLERLGIQPVFLQENSPEFREMRNRLKTESGIIISNHPGWGDTPAILSAVNREDLKIMMSKKYFGLLPSEIADKYFFPSENDPSKATTVFKEIQDHISKGGVVLIYPSGGNEEKEGTGFKDGFRVLLRGLKPDQMVYCFNISSQDVSNLSSQYPGISVASEAFLDSVLDIDNNKVAQPVRIDEAYTKAGEWQKSIEGVPKNETSKVLTGRYEGMFSGGN